MAITITDSLHREGYVLIGQNHTRPVCDVIKYSIQRLMVDAIYMTLLLRELWGYYILQAMLILILLTGAKSLTILLYLRLLLTPCRW